MNRTVDLNRSPLDIPVVNIDALAENWWAIALRGVVSVIFGVLTLVLPALTLAALVLMFGAYALVEGIFNLIAAVRGADRSRPRWLLVLEGLVSIGAGIVTMVLPGLTALVLAYIIGAWAIITGALETAAAISLRTEIKGEWTLVLSGLLSLIFGVLMLAAPASGALALVMVIGAYAIAFGVLLLILAFRLRGRRRETRVPMARAA
jgi:uncharacterized membrane protein HdeD (DUF308 family)